MSLLTKEIEVKWGPRNKRHYTSLGYVFTKMGDSFTVKVEDLPSGSDVKVNVRCDYCNKDYRPAWQHFLTGRRRIEKDACSGNCGVMKRTEIKILDGAKTVADIPELLEEWHESNEEDPSKVLAGSNFKYRWKCKSCSGEWKARPKDRTQKKGCPHCAGMTEARFNRYNEPLSVTHPELVEEWSDKNELRPDEITAGSNKPSIWECKTCSNTWTANPNRRTNGHGCPHCANYFRYNESLSVTHPELIEEWSDRNDLRPSEVTAGSEKRIIWKCSTCSHEWRTSPNHRTSGNGCPSCSESKGEKLVAKILDELNVCYAREYSFDKLRGSGGGSLRYDFAILNEGEPIALIEHDGIQHFKSIEYFGGEATLKRQQLHDRLKDDYARKRNIPLLRIRYDQSEEEVKEIVSEFVQIQKEFEKAV